MRRFASLSVLTLVAFVLLVGCANVDDKPVVRISDNDGSLEPRVITVGYANDRLGRMAPNLLPDTGGDEGKRQFLSDIVRKELMVIAAHRLGFDEDPRLATAGPYFEKQKAQTMWQHEFVDAPSDVSEEELVQFDKDRRASYQLQETPRRPIRVGSRSWRGPTCTRWRGWPSRGSRRTRLQSRS